MASEESWKDKYHQELESADQRESLWDRERNILERMLLRACVASQGQSPELDELLARIRADIRNKQIDADLWLELQEQLDRQIALLDQPRQQTREDAPAPQVSGPGPMSAGAKDLEDDGQRLRIARRVGELLGQLLKQVSLESEAETQARTLQRMLLSSDNWEELREGLNQVAELVITAVSRSQREFEAFLKRLDERLVMLRDNFSSQYSAQSGRIEATEHLDREIRDKLERVGRDIEASGDLGQLKQSVTRHLESIGQAVGNYRIQETEREQALSEQLAAMQEKIAAMEAHSEQMQDQIRRERQRAMTDLLTQLPNREAWQERLSFEFNRWQRYRHPLIIGVIDIDLFKRINDAYGHKAGDRVLQLVAKELKDRLRNTDFIARFGGEEFVVLLPETTAEDAARVMDKLRSHIRSLPFHFRGEPVTVTFSAGLAEFTAGDSEETVFERADRALYHAKDAGRDRVCVETCDQ